MSTSDPTKLNGYTIIKSRTKDGRETSVAVQAPPGMQVIRRPEPDPHAGSFTLTEALKGLAGKGALTATIHTSLGMVSCQLFDDKAPKTVANFVGLARGLRKYWDTRENAWIGKNYFDGTTFHRVIPGFMIQGGDYLGNGSGLTGFEIPDELHPTLKHDRAGLLCMANRGPNTNAAQFFITDASTPHLDNSYTIFGECAPLDVIARIARVPQSGPGNTPITPVVMERVEISRGRPARAAIAPASTPLPIPRGAHVANKVGAPVREPASP
jgi:peptidyl-prolyl cis-trans isomerase A (cyclophilin A)